MSEMLAKTDLNLLFDYITDEYIQRGMSYGDYLAFLCNTVTPFTDLPEMSELVGRSGLPLKAATAFVDRMMAVRDERRIEAIATHNANIERVNTCVGRMSCFACYVEFHPVWVNSYLILRPRPNKP